MRLKQFIAESIEDKGILKACFLGGFPGSGKSYIVSKVSSGQIEPRIVNTDKYVEFLKAFKASEWVKVEDKVKLLTKNQLVLYLNSMLPLFIDGTSSNPSSLARRNGILKSIGYDTSFVWVDTSIETSIERAKKRKREVTEKDIRKIYNKLEGLKTYYSKDFRHFTEILNDEGELTEKVILQAFKKVTSFFNSPIENPIGQKLVEKMRSKGEKYLTDGEYTKAFLKKLVSTWYT